MKARKYREQLPSSKSLQDFVAEVDGGVVRGGGEVGVARRTLGGPAEIERDRRIGGRIYSDLDLNSQSRRPTQNGSSNSHPASSSMPSPWSSSPQHHAA